MDTVYSMVPIGEVARPIKRPEEPIPGVTYRQVGVRLWGEGAYERDPLDGAETRYKRLFRVEADDIIVNKIWARNGSVAIVLSELAGCYGSSEFPTFEPNRQRLEPRWFHWMTKTRFFWQQCDEKSHGTSGKNRIRPERFLEILVPLPPLAEQRRIVARIEELAAKVEAARALRQQAAQEAGALFASAINQIWSDQENWAENLIGKIATTVSGQVEPTIEPYASLPHINGEFIESGTCRLLPGYRLAKEDGITSGKYHFQANAVLYSKIRPYLKKAVQVPFEGICSADIYAFENIDPEVESRFFMYSLISPQFSEYANSLSGRTRIPKLNQKQLFSYRMAYPPLPEQQRIVAYLDDLQARVAAVQVIQAATAAELETLLPSVLDKAFKGEL